MKLVNDYTGFEWGPARVTRVFSDPKHGVWLVVAGAKEEIEIRVTRGGRIRAGRPRKAADPFKPTK